MIIDRSVLDTERFLIQSYQLNKVHIVHCNAEEYSAISVMSQFPFSLHIKSFYNPKQMHFLLLRLQCDPFLNHNSISLSNCACHKIMFSLDLWLLLWQYLRFFSSEIALQNVFALGCKHYPPKLATSTAHQACQEPNLLEMCLIEQQ